MDMLTEYIWPAIGGAALIGFLLAWILRGIMLAGRKRRATVERDVALTELEQVRGELDSLYAAQRKQKASQTGEAPANLDSKLRERDERLERMAGELEAAKTELDSLRAAPPSSPQAAESGTDGADTSELEARNAWLEERVGELEAKLHDMSAAEPVAAEAAVPEGPGEAAQEDKLEWQVDYLKTRVAALEEELLKAEAAPTPSTEDAGKAEPEPAAPDTSAVDEELARLRWRNRYLEGRLAYFEEMPEASDDSPAAEAEAPAPEGAFEAKPELVSEEPQEADAEEDTTPAEVEADETDEDEPAEEETVHPAEGFLRALEAREEAEAAAGGVSEEAPAEDEDSETTEIQAVQPPALEEPDGEADDLTLITGIGPRIQTILNDLGIWHFSQIAEWSEEHEAWVDEQLNFAGRVSREDWIQQARDLVAANQSAGTSA